ncbi:hypothetical protein [Propionivibrio limicola]|uniref:hypothetical protein n=1 Tax=Propionivibrio limicola TaxID=167645 RepID=UPI001290D322|nr:hypothetical protein [Propionivibrio limicola]
MKIHQLALGARFEYEGEEYVKTGPLLGSGKRGQRLIPRYAVLKPLDGVPPQEAPRDAVAKTDVVRAFEVFCEECRELVPEDRQAALEAGRERFLKALG